MKFVPKTAFCGQVLKLPIPRAILGEIQILPLPHPRWQSIPFLGGGGGSPIESVFGYNETWEKRKTCAVREVVVVEGYLVSINIIVPVPVPDPRRFDLENVVYSVCALKK